MRTNIEDLVKISVSGEIVHPSFRRSPYRVSADGEVMVVPSTGGITYNVRVGDSALTWVADHVEPGVTVKNPKGGMGTEGPNGGLNVLGCIGNVATVVSGKAEGATGLVTGKHGGSEHLIIDFAPDAMEKMVPGDRILVVGWGVGMKLLDHPGVRVSNMSPQLLEKWKIEEMDGGIRVPVTHRIPGKIMGAGLGWDTVHHGDYDITFFDEGSVEEYGLNDLRLGDLVALMDAGNSYGHIYRQGCISVGIVIHGDSYVAGHGPGVTTLFAAEEGQIEPVLDPTANIASVMGLRSDL